MCKQCFIKVTKLEKWKVSSCLMSPAWFTIPASLEGKRMLRPLISSLEDWPKGTVQSNVDKTWSSIQTLGRSSNTPFQFKRWSTEKTTEQNDLCIKANTNLAIDLYWM